MSQDESSKKPATGAASKDTAATDAASEDTAATDAASTPVDPHNISVSVAAGELAGDLPEELADTRVVAADEPATGLVAEFRDLTFNQGAYLVSARETAGVSRSPIFYLTTLIIGLAVLAALIFGVAQARANASGQGQGTVATVGMGEQAPLFEQQYGFKVLDTQSPDEAEQAVRDGRADVALITDPTGMAPPRLVALDKKPVDIINALNPVPEITYLEPPAVSFQVAQPMAIGLAGLLIAAALTMAFALYNNLRVEKRHRIAEIIAASIPAKASAVGRVQGLTWLSVVHLVVAGALLLMGLSVTAYSGVAIDLLPALGWFALLYLVTVCATLALFLWASNIVGRRLRQILLGVVCALVIVGAFLPLIFAKDANLVQIFAYIPFTAPVATALHFMGSQATWWNGLVAVGISLAFALIALALAAAAYQSNLLRGSGRETLSAKQRKKLKERATSDAKTEDKAEDKAGETEDEADAKAEDKAEKAEDKADAKAEDEAGDKAEKSDDKAADKADGVDDKPAAETEDKAAAESDGKPAAEAGRGAEVGQTSAPTPGGKKPTDD